MSVRKVLRMGHPCLQRPADPVTAFDTPELQVLVTDLFDTMAAENGAGLAAPQIGVSVAVVAFGFDANPRYPDAEPVPRTVLVNPGIEPLSADQDVAWEGCLSLPGLRGLVPRWTHIRYRGFDPSGAPIQREATGFHARVVQHECDHLSGILYPQRMTDLSQFGFVDELTAAARMGAAS
ncbi:MAG TPA: peptide deformylase, partial [Gammaproteobacteria bacterium]|nr:peptide deformylase [Gammaproteobacteria bacterium]